MQAFLTHSHLHPFLLEEHLEHLNEAMQGNGAPNGIFEVDEIGCFATEGLRVGDVFMLSALKLSDGDDHGNTFIEKSMSMNRM